MVAAASPLLLLDIVGRMWPEDRTLCTTGVDKMDRNDQLGLNYVEC